MKKVKKNKIEFSKKILIFAGIINTVVIVYSMIIMWRTGDTTPLCYLIPSVAAEVSAGTSWYYSKAKVENEIKLKSIYKQDDNLLPPKEDVMI